MAEVNPAAKKKRKCGAACAYKGCGYKFYSKSESPRRRLFRFPKDKAVSDLWIENCGRNDLLGKDPKQLFNNFRLCSIHFEDRMFYSSEKSRLLPLGVPKKCACETQTDVKSLMDETATITTYYVASPSRASSEEDSEESPAKKTKILQNILLATTDVYPPAETSDDVVIKTETFEETAFMMSSDGIQTVIKVENLPLTIEESTCVMSSVETQTPKSLSENSPRKLKLRAKISSLCKENNMLKKEIEKMCSEQEPEEPNVQDFVLLCDKFLNPELSKFVKAQIHLSDEDSHG